MATLSYSSLTKTSVTLTSSGAGTPSNDRYWTFTITPGSFSDVVGPNKSTSASCSFSGLSPGTTYTATCRYGPASNKTQYSGGSCTFTTDSPQTLPSGTAKLEEVSKTTTSLKIKVSGITSYSSFTRIFYWLLNGSRVKTTTGVAGTTTSDTYEFTGLSPGTTYTVRFEYKRTGAEYDTYYVSDSFTTYATGDSGSCHVGDVTTNSIMVYLDSITSRSYDRTVYFHWYNTSTGTSGSPSLILSAGETSISRQSVNLQAGTKYRYQIEVLNPDGSVNYKSDYMYATTISYATSDSGSCHAGDSTLNTITVYLDYITPREYNRTVYFNWYNTSSGTSGSPSLTLEANASSISRVAVNLIEDTKYRFQIVVQNPDGNITYTSEYFYATTANTNYTLKLSTSSTYSTITATVTVDAVQSYDLDLTVYLDDDRALEIDIAAGSLSRSRTWGTGTALTPATKYAVKLWDKIKDEYQTLNRRTKNNFSWSTDVSSGALFNLKASDWNDFTSQLSTKCNYYSLAGTYTFDVANKGANFTAKMFNQAVDAINGLVDWNSGDCVTKMNKVSVGDSIMADDMNQLAKCLNE